MCGIAGYIGSKKKLPKKVSIKNCLRSLKQRGPDSSGYFCDKKKIMLFYYYIQDYL